MAFNHSRPLVAQAFTMPMNTIVQSGYDRVDVTYPSSAVEVYAFSWRGRLMTTVTVTYTDAGKDDLLSAVAVLEPEQGT